jgi:Subtilase family
VPLPRAVAWVQVVFAAAFVATALLPPPAAASAAPRSSPASELARHRTAVVALDGDRRAQQLVRRAGGRVVSDRLQLWELPGRTAARLEPRLRALDALRYAEPARERPNGVHFTDPLSSQPVSWHLYAVGANLVEPPGPGFPVTVVDAGLDLAHVDFAGRPDTVALNTQTTDFVDLDEYHGTLVASTAAAATNGVGAEGLYPRALLRVFDVDEPTSAAVVRGIEAALRAGPSVINLSLGGPIAAQAEYEAILMAVRSGSLVVAASGNSLGLGNPPEYPAAFPHVLTVGAVDRALQPASFSSSGPGLDLAAPGVDIPFAHPTDPDPARSLRVNGTSFSAPIVAASAAWVLTARPDLRPAQVAEVLRRTARDLSTPGFDRRTGFGLLDLPAALAAPAPPVDPLEPNDDVDQVTAGRFGRAQVAVNGTKGGNATLTASVDSAEDPHDVYRVVVPSGRRVVVTVAADGNARAALWGRAASSVKSGRSQRLAFSNRPGTNGEQVAWTNRRAGAMTVFLDVSPGAGGQRPRYTAAIRLVRAPR